MEYSYNKNEIISMNILFNVNEEIINNIEGNAVTIESKINVMNTGFHFHFFFLSFMVALSQ